MAVVRLSYGEAQQLLDRIFASASLTPLEATVCSAELLDAQWRGKASYGLELVPHLVSWRAQKTGEPRVEHETPVSAFIEGNDGIGPVVAAAALDVALDKARHAGLAAVGVRNKWPWLVAGYHLRRAAEAGFVALTWSAGVSILAPHGAVRPVFGTNPIAIAAPSTSGPIVFDTALTAGPASVLRDAKRRGEPLPEGVAIDRHGHPTLDPVAARNGAMLPVGGHRGSGLAMMIELLGGAWVGAKTGRSRAGTRGFVYIVADSDLFGFGDTFDDAAEGLVRDVMAAAEQPSHVHIPGRRRVDFDEPCEIDEELFTQLNALVTPP